MTTRYVPVTEVAKLARQALKEAWPATKFSVRSDRSIRVSWHDGPLPRDVSAFLEPFRGATFDGMTDMKEHYRHTLDGQLVSLMADYVFTQREITPEGEKRLRLAFEALDAAAQFRLMNDVPAYRDQPWKLMADGPIAKASPTRDRLVRIEQPIIAASAEPPTSTEAPAAAAADPDLEVKAGILLKWQEYLATRHDLAKSDLKIFRDTFDENPMYAFEWSDKAFRASAMLKETTSWLEWLAEDDSGVGDRFDQAMESTAIDERSVMDNAGKNWTSTSIQTNLLRDHLTAVKAALAAHWRWLLVGTNLKAAAK